MGQDIFGLEGPSPDDLLGLNDETTPEPTEDAVEGPPEVAEAPAPEADEPQERPRDEHGRFVAQDPVEGTEDEVPAPEIEGEEVDIPASENVAEEILEEAAPRLYAGKYEDPDQLERGYNESREMWRRATEARKAEEQARYAAELREAELANIIKEALPYLQVAAQREQQFHAFAQQYKETTGEYPQGYQGPPQPQQQPQLRPQDVEALVAQRLEQERYQLQAGLQEQQAAQQLEQNIMGFFQDHPEVEPYGPIDNEITDTAEVLNQAWSARTGEEVDMSDRGTLEVLYEAAQDPAFRSVLALKPEYFDSEEGLKLARIEAAAIRDPNAATAITQRRVPASQVGQTGGPKPPFAEGATTGAAVEEAEDENDPWTAIARSARKGQNPASVFQFE